VSGLRRFFSILFPLRPKGIEFDVDAPGLSHDLVDVFADCIIIEGVYHRRMWRASGFRAEEFQREAIVEVSDNGRGISDAMRSHPRVCLQVDQIDDDFHWRSAIAFGNFEEIDRPSERRAVLGKLLSSFPKLTPVESRIVQDAAAPDSIVFRITVDRVTGVEEE
jgi:hypothetical protein